MRDELLEMFVQANRLLDEGRKDLAFPMFIELAEKGYKYSFNTVGLLLDSGARGEVAKSDAMSWFRRAARAGDTCGAANLGISYLDKGNRKMARKWLSRAISMGDVDAGVDLASTYFGPNGVRQRVRVRQILESVLAWEGLDSESRRRAADMLKKVSQST
ncbi:hypothetical protein ABU614_00410 [Lysobacter firmicutimachus]|uniref:Sel1 repeat family protein n=1 Tax=Lysobacter firmicutimachus TaxID=1792846 RepID=A0AAU8MV92_9GAMM